MNRQKITGKIKTLCCYFKSTIYYDKFQKLLQAQVVV